MTNKYLYQGKERGELTGLDDFEWRQYDPLIGRTPTMDPNGEEYASWSPYSFLGNNPLSMVDPDGMDWYSYTNEDGQRSYIWQEGNAKNVEIDGNKYENIGSMFATRLEDGSIVVYNQNEVFGIIDADQPVGDAHEQALVNKLMDPQAEIQSSTMTQTWEMTFFSAETAIMIGSAASMSGSSQQNLRNRRTSNLKPRGHNPQLNEAQKQNLQRFVKKAPSNSKPPTVRQLGNGNIEISIESPGKVPGSKAVYVKEINGNGQTVKMYKITSDPRGNIVHNKNKL